MDVRQYGYDMGMVIDGQIEGIFASRSRDKHAAIARLVFEAGNGDHLEVGTLYGASAILAALTKQQFGLSGRVYCVDPFIDGNIDPTIKELTTFEVSPERVRRNAERLGVSLNVAKMPFAEYEIKGRFASAYIDGDHSYEGVKADWEKASKHVDRLVFFDDYNDARFPGVKRFIDELEEPGWQKEIIGQIAVMRRE